MRSIQSEERPSAFVHIQPLIQGQAPTPNASEFLLFFFLFTSPVKPVICEPVALYPLGVSGAVGDHGNSL